MRRTKIVCTLGPASSDPEVIDQLVAAGMDCARLNFSHGDHASHREMAEKVRAASARARRPLAILADLCGPKMRIGRFADGKIELKEGASFTITTRDVQGTVDEVSVSYEPLPRDVKVGDAILLDDGLFKLRVTGKTDTDVHTEVEVGGTLSDRKGLNLPGVDLSTPALTEKDKKDLAFAVDELQVDYLALSFVRNPEDVQQAQALAKGTPVIAKLEKPEAIENLGAILDQADGAMVARGDLGVEMGSEKVPLIQKRIIRETNLRSKIVITATQMLDSMIENPRPTRAELTDVANAIFDGTDAVMLSGETATGRYPTKACATLDRIACAVEASREYQDRAAGGINLGDESTDIGSAIAKATFVVATDVEAAAIIAPSLRGNSPRLLSKHRPSQPIIAVTTTEEVQRQLLLYWGIVPLVAEEVLDSEQMVQNAIRNALDRGLIERSDRVVTTAGIPLHSAIPMNTIKVHILGTVLNRGHQGFGGKATGRVVKAMDAPEARRRLRLDSTEILVTAVLTSDHVDLLGGLLGVILEDRSQVAHEEIREANESLIVISEVPNALFGVEDGITVTVDGEEKIIYEGVL